MQNNLFENPNFNLPYNLNRKLYQKGAISVKPLPTFISLPKNQSQFCTSPKEKQGETR